MALEALIWLLNLANVVLRKKSDTDNKFFMRLQEKMPFFDRFCQSDFVPRKKATQQHDSTVE
jgi:hypothetical protein